MPGWFPFAASPLRAVVAAALILKACPPEGPDADEEPPPEPVAAQAAPTPEPTPPPGLDEADLLPFPADDPRRAAALALREALSAVDAGDLDRALARLDASAAAGGGAPGLTAWTRGRVLRGLGRDDDAAAAWAGIPPASRWWPEAALERASLRLAAGDPDGVLSILGASGPPRADDATPTRDDQTLRADVLRARALRARDADGDCDAAYGACKRVWASAPEDSEAWTAAREGMQALEARVPDALRPGLAEKVSRARVLARAQANDAIVELLDGERDALDSAGADVGCAARFELGRAWHKKRDYGRSVPLVGWVADHCDDEDLGPSAAYLLSQGLERSGRVDEAIASWRSLADRWPTHRFADDGLFHAGQLQLGAGRTEDARGLFLSMPDRFPEGDMVDDALWGMAWSELIEERWDQARPWLEQLAEGDPRSRARARVLRGRYWLARTDLAEGRTDAATAAWRALAVDAPLDWYGVLALWRLQQLDPAAAAEASAELQAARERLLTGPRLRERWPADPTFLASPALQHGVELLRGGLTAEAAEEFKIALGESPQDTWGADTRLLASHLLLLADDPYAGHNLLRLAFRRQWPAETPDQRVAFELAYPRAYGDLIDDVTSGFGWDPLLFQGLVREESAFAAAIRSWAGAMGLSQLMWPTAKGTAKRMGIEGLRREDLSDPRTNLSIGSTYFEGVSQRWKGHMPLAIASYNAGPGAVGKWVKARGDQDLDAFVESIPFDETRAYVKRVTTSWQIYHWLYGAGGPSVPLRVGPVADALSAADPTIPRPTPQIPD